MKKLLLLSILPSILFILSGCDLNIKNQEATNIKKEIKPLENKQELLNKEQGQIGNLEKEDLVTENNITTYTNIDQFLGKPTILIWGSTSCPHCINAMPIFEKDIYNPYKEDINILLNTLSQDKFKTSLPQIQNSPFSFKSVSGESCGYIPQWIMLDSEGNIIEKSCGGEKSVDDIKVKLKELGVE